MSIFGYIFAVALLIFVLVGIWYEERFIEFEDKICDRLGYIIAKTYLKVKKMRIKRLVKSTDSLAKRVGK